MRPPRARRRQRRERSERPRQNRPTRTSEAAHAREGIVAPPGLLTPHARTEDQAPDDLHDSVITDLHFSMDTGNRSQAPGRKPCEAVSVEPSSGALTPAAAMAHAAH